MFLVADNLINLGKEFESYLNNSLSDDLKLKYQEKVDYAAIKNPWFIKNFVDTAFDSWRNALTRGAVNQWFENIKPKKSIKNISVIAAGNLPLVALHDCLAVLSSGHNLWLKCASDDDVLLPFVLERLCALSPGLQQHIEFKTQGLQKADALIATGSNNSSRYFEYYFKHMPSIIRKNRTSVAVLNNDVSNGDLRNIAKDMFLFFGRGCRSVAKLYLPEDFNIQRIFENSTDFSYLKNHNKYANNFDYHRAIYLMNRDAFLENDFFVLKESDMLHAPVSVYFYERYRDKAHLDDLLKANKNDLQVVCGNGMDVDFGNNQCPSLSDYADNVNTLKFLDEICV